MKASDLLFMMLLLTGCATQPVEMLPECDNTMAVAERDLSGASDFNRHDLVYRTADGVLCRV